MSVTVEIIGTVQAKCSKCGKKDECLETLTEIESDDGGLYLSLMTWLCQACVSKGFKSFDKDK